MGRCLLPRPRAPPRSSRTIPTACRGSSTSSKSSRRIEEQERMRLINRTAVSVVGAEPYVEWTRSRDAAFAPAKELSVSVPRAKPFGSVYLLPDGVEEEDLLE